MAITLPRVRKSAAYRSRFASGNCAFTRSSSAGNFLAFGEVVTPPCSAPPALPLIGRRYHTPLNPRNKSLLTNLSRSQSGPQNDKHGCGIICFQQANAVAKWPPTCAEKPKGAGDVSECATVRPECAGRERHFQA